MSHLTPDEIVDAIDGVLGSARHAHLGSCIACRTEVDRLTAVLGQTRSVTVPEPSPLFWQHFSRRVRVAIAEEPAAAGWPQWLRWPVLTPLAAMALLVMALMTAVLPVRAPAPDPVAIDDSTAPAADMDFVADSVWAFIAESIGPLDVETALQAGIATSPGEAERAALDLSDAEQAELVRLLQQELTKSGS
jgi:hypothetical protein